MKTIQTTKEYYQEQVNKNNQIIQDLKAKLTPKEIKDLIARIDLAIS
tara:strand:- start:138 stop:278 length:141 start_codon:yes stop_codon:yes gene_type:complete